MECILPISQVGILQMTHQRQQESLSSNLYTDCPYCRGRGFIKSATTMSIELQRKLSSVVRRLQLRNDGGFKTVLCVSLNLVDFCDDAGAPVDDRHEVLQIVTP
jgi:Ribonuclease G/E